MRKYKYEEMTPNEFLKAVEEMPVFFVPTGLLEWHGDHLPLGVDSLKAYSLCLETAKKLGGGIILPPNYYGRPGYSRYVGTLTFSEALMDLLINELFDQLKKVGAKIIVLLTGHHGSLQDSFIKRVSSYYEKENPDIHIISLPDYENVRVNNEIPGDHAGKWETSYMLYFYPHLVKMDKFRKDQPVKVHYSNPPNDYYKEDEEWTWENLPKVASKELGQKAANLVTDNLSQLIKNALSDLEG